VRYPKRHRFGCVQVEGIHEQFYMPILLGLVTRHLKHKVAQLVYLTTLRSLHSANSVFLSYQINTSQYFFSHNKSAPATSHSTPNNARRPRSAREESSPRLPWKKTTYTEETGQQSLSDVLRDFDTEAKVARKHCTHHIPGTERNCLSSLPAQNLHRPHISFARTDPEKKQSSTERR